MLNGVGAGLLPYQGIERGFGPPPGIPGRLIEAVDSFIRIVLAESRVVPRWFQT